MTITIDELRSKRKWRVFWMFMLLLIICVPLEVALFTVLNICQEDWAKSIIYTVSILIAVGVTGIIVHELPYSLEDVTAKKGRWFIKSEVALYEEMLKHSDLDDITEKINNNQDKTYEKFKKKS